MNDIQKITATFSKPPRVVVDNEERNYQEVTLNGKKCLAARVDQSTWFKLKNRPDGRYDLVLVKEGKKPLDDYQITLRSGVVSKVKQGGDESRPGDIPSFFRDVGDIPENARTTLSIHEIAQNQILQDFHQRKNEKPNEAYQRRLNSAQKAKENVEKRIREIQQQLERLSSPPRTDQNEKEEKISVITEDDARETLTRNAEQEFSPILKNLQIEMQMIEERINRLEKKCSTESPDFNNDNDR